MITQDEIITIAQSVLGTMFQIEAVPDEVFADSFNAEPAFTGCVQISGQWQGAVLVQGTCRLERILASVFFDIGESEVTDTDIRDAIAEITNMIGGNIKGQVPSPSFLSIPSVAVGNDFNFHLPGATLLSQAVLGCHGEPLRIVLCEQTGNS